MKIKVYTSDLEPGMYVCELDRPWLGTPFLFQGFPIRSQVEIEQLQEHCQYVYVDGEKSAAPLETLMRLRATGAMRATSAGGARPPRLDPSIDRSIDSTYRALRTNLREAHRVITSTRGLVDRMLEDARLGTSVDTNSAKEIVGQLVERVVANPDALLWLTHLKQRDEYTATHCVNVCVLAITFGRWLGLANEALRDLGLGALLHDLGKMRVPSEVLNKAGRLTDEEFAVMKAHPEIGHRLLSEGSDLSPEVLDIVLYHHERIGGQGYPAGLCGEQLGRYTKIVSIVDVYDAVTSDRVYHDGISPSAALKNLYNWAPNNFDLDLIEAFIRSIGIYPVGSLVQLNTGDVGVVVASNESHRLRPLILLVLDAEHQPHGQRRLINLASPVWESGPVKPRIERVLEPGAYGIDVRPIIAEEARSTRAGEAGPEDTGKT